jgi:hypothetical protein
MMPSINLEEYPKWICSVLIENVNDDVVKDTRRIFDYVINSSW